MADARDLKSLDSSNRAGSIPASGTRFFRVNDQDGIHNYSEDYIREYYFPFWQEQMKKMGKEPEISFEECLEDWITINWAEEIK